MPVREGVNGHAIPAEGDSVAAFTMLISGYLQDPAAYVRLRATSRQEYETRLNWRAWGHTVRDRIIAARTRIM